MMWNEVCKGYIPYDGYLIDIKGDAINNGDIVRDPEGFTFKFKWDSENREWVAISLRENNKEYPMYQERVNRNRFVIVQ